MKTLVIINPVSGKQQRTLEEWRAPVRINFPQAEIVFTQRAGHATELAAQAVQQGVEKILVAGGDGTINETARALVHTPVALGIIPKGSGNGLAREIGIPLRFEEALAALQKAQPVACDVGVANGSYFFNVAGIGIEAEIARRFAEYGKTGQRGMWPYFKLGAQALFQYKPTILTVEYQNQHIVYAPLTLVFANGTQYGSGFYIAPQASLTDGKLEMVEVKNAPKWKLACHLFDFFQKNPLSSDFTNTQQVEQAIVTSEQEMVYHLDGEPQTPTHRLVIGLQPKALHLLMVK